jgi:hypothetical protein
MGFLNIMKKINFLTFIFLLLSLVVKGQPFDSLKTCLEKIQTNGLKNRKSIREIIALYGSASPQMDSLNKKLRYSDSIDLILVTKIIDKYGWLDRNKVGNNSNQALFLTIQHSNLTTMEKYFPKLKESAERKQSSLTDVALLEDRIMILKGLPQIYGTQYKYVESKKNFQFYPIKNIKGINRRRRSVGLTTLKKYAKLHNVVLTKFID